MSHEYLVRALHVLVEGLVMQPILTPELCPTKRSTQRSRRWAPE
jgi:hypothetical protein